MYIAPIGAYQNLPSSDSARDFVQTGSLSSAGRVVLHMVGRAALLGLGLRAFGAPRPAKALVHDALAGAAAIELFALAWFAVQAGD